MCRHIFATLAQMALVIFWPVGFSPFFRYMPKINTIFSSGACDKPDCFLCVVFVSEEQTRELIKESRVVLPGVCWITLNHCSIQLTTIRASTHLVFNLSTFDKKW